MAPLLYREPVTRPAFDALVVATSPADDGRVLGLRCGERARRVAARVGAQRVLVVSEPDAAAAWWSEAPSDRALLIIDARATLVHMPLIEPLLDAGDAPAIAVDGHGAPAGAVLLRDDDARAAAADPMAALTTWTAREDVRKVPHGEIARHAAGTPRERRAAARYLEQIVHKMQDGPVTRWLYRPVSVPISRLLVLLPITPNQISMIVAVLGVIGVYLTAHASYDAVLLGSAIILIAGYIDGCDGEVARLKLLSSKLGAWMDTVTDESTTVLYLAALGYHNYLRYDEPWILGTIAIAVASYVLSIYIIYYYLVVVHGSANSQDYVDRLEIVDGPTPGTRSLRPIETEALSGIWAWLPHLARRDFVNWAALAFAALHLTHVSYALMVIGGVPAVLKLIPDHLRLRRQLRTLRG